MINVTCIVEYSAQRILVHTSGVSPDSLPSVNPNHRLLLVINTFHHRTIRCRCEVQVCFLKALNATACRYTLRYSGLRTRPYPLLAPYPRKSADLFSNRGRKVETAATAPPAPAPAPTPTRTCVVHPRRFRAPRSLPSPYPHSRKEIQTERVCHGFATGTLC